MKRIHILIMLIVLFALSACSAADEKQDIDKTVLTESPFVMEYSDDGVDEFIKLNSDYKSGYEQDTCYNITPAFIKENADYLIFKYDQSCESFLLHEGKRYPIGVGFGALDLQALH